MLRYIIATVLLAASSAAFGADEPRKIDFQTVLVDQDGKGMTECADDPAPKGEEVCKVRRPVTLGMLALRALSAPEQNLAQDESLKRGQLALSIYKSASAQLTVEEIALIKKQIAKFFGPVVVARSFSLLDPAAK
jgi:hypothetical protein